MLTVGLIYNLKKNDAEQTDTYLEYDDPSTVEAIKNALEKNFSVIPIEADSGLLETLCTYRNKLDMVFNIAEGRKGSWREATVPVILEELDIPYVGSDPATMVLCLDKQRTKEVLAFNKIPHPAFKVFTEVPELGKKDMLPLEFPLIVKPLWEGSSKGIKNSSLVIDINKCQNEIARIIQTYAQPALVEEFIPGREFTVGILGNGDNILVLPLVEVNFSKLPKGAAPIYSYEAKWVWDVPEAPLDIFTCPAVVDNSLKNNIEAMVLNAYRALGCRDWCRIDMRLDMQGKPYILELNPIPGIIPDPKCNSCMPKAAYALGWEYQKLVNIVLTIACRRYGIVYEKR